MSNSFIFTFSFVSCNTLSYLKSNVRSKVTCRRPNCFSFCTSELISSFQMKPTRCTLLLSTFISTSLHVSGNYVPNIRRIYCTYATLVLFTVCGWLSGLLQQTRQPPITNSVALVRTRTIPTERPPPVGEVSANFCG